MNLFKKKVMQPQPKFAIGDEVYYLDYSKMKCLRITGVCVVYEPDKTSFNGYMYWVDKRESVETYSWMSEKRLFASKEDLIASL